MNLVPIIQVRNLSHAYRLGRNALDEINLEIMPGEMIAVIGQNGAGKTTLTKHFNGLLKPTTGSVQVANQDTSQTSTDILAQTVGYVFQNPDHQIFHDMVYNEVAFGPRNLGLNGSELASRVNKALEAVSLTEYVGVDPAGLSRGQRQRVALASVLAMETQVIVLDEPTTGQDHQEARQIMTLVQDLNRRGHTVIFITHDMELVLRYAQRVIVLGGGKILLDGTIQQVFSYPDILRATNLTLPRIVDLVTRLQPFGIDPRITDVEALARAIAQRVKANSKGT